MRGAMLIAVWRQLLGKGPVRLLVLLTGIVLSAVVAIQVDNRFGFVWGGFIGIGLGPLILTKLLQHILGVRRGRHSHRHWAISTVSLLGCL